MNFNNFEYLIVLFLVGIVPLLVLLHPLNQLRKPIKKVVLSILLASIPFLIWDVWATARGHWAFNPNYILPFKIINLPFEEILFFWIVPFACLTLWPFFRDFQGFKKLYQQVFLIKNDD